MNKVLIDTDILIDHLRGLDKAKEYLKKIESGKVKGVILSTGINCAFLSVRS